MKAAVISLGSKSSLMVAEAMKKYFEQVDIIPLKNIEVDLGREGGIFYEEKLLGDYDCIYLKGSFRYAHLLRSIASLLKEKVPYMPLPDTSFTIAHNKLLTHLAMQQRRIPMPKTYVSPTVETARELLKKVKYPIVMKFPEGTQGKGVLFADSLGSASSVLDALGVLKQPFIIQEYIETGSTDIRALVVGKRVVAAMRRKAQTEEKRANIHAGGKGEPVKLSREIINLALDTAETLNADICGVDILEGPLGPLVIEANISPGLQGLQEVSAANLADEIARYLYQETEKIVKSRRAKEAEKVMEDISPENGSLSAENGSVQEIITALHFRGERILLPEFVTRLAEFSDRKEYILKVGKGRMEIEESG